MIILDITLKVCLVDGTDILVDGFDKLSFTNELPTAEITNSGYSWQKDYDELLNNTDRYAFLTIQRSDYDNLEYRQKSYVFKNSEFKSKKPFTFRTTAIVTIIDMYS